MHRGAFALTTITRDRTVSVRARNPNHSAWAGAPPHSGHHSASPAVLRSTHTSELFYLTAGSCDPARQEHFSAALEAFVRRWRPATFDYAMHTGRRRVSSGLAGPHPDSTDSRGRSTSQPERMLTPWGAKMTKNGKLVEKKMSREVMRTVSEYPKAYFTRP